MLSSYSVPKLRYGPFTLNTKMHTAINFVYAFNWNKTAKLYLPSTFQTSDIELLSPKIEN